MNSKAPSHLEATLQRAIDLIRNKVVEMAALDEHALQNALRALIERSRQLAYAVILRDQYIDELEKELDRLCLEFFVRQQPAAGHLRFVYSTVKIVKELERIGDYAESVARQVLKVSSLESPPPYDKFVEIANLSIAMLRDAIRAFVDKNADLAKATMTIEAKADQVRNGINADLLELRQADRLSLEALTALMTVARRYERVADQAKNICEEVLYMTTGEYIKHLGAGVFRIVFVDADNACVSQMAEGISNSLGLDKFVFSSAGLEPRPIDPATLRFMSDQGIDISHQTAKSVAQVPNLEYYQVVVLLDREARKAVPLSPAKPVVLEWGLENPSLHPGPAAAVQAAYEKSFQYLNTHIRELVQAILGNPNPGT